MTKAQPAFGLAVLAALCGCAAGPDFDRPEAPAADRYTLSATGTTVAAEGVSQRFAMGETLAADWWRMFRSPPIDAAVKAAVEGNPGLQAAQARLRQSRNLAQAGYGVFFPSLGTDASGTRQQISPAKLDQPGTGSVFNLFTLSATINYALDVFGGQSRQVEELEAQADTLRYQERGAYLTLTANVVNAMIAKAAYKAEIDATAALIELQTQQVHLAEVQAKAGTAAYSSVLALRSQLAATQATLPQLQQKLGQTDDLLAALSGRAPAERQAVELDFSQLTLPDDLPVSLPSDLVRQRPDILASEAAAHAASADIGVATAAMLPSFTMSGTYGVNATQTASLFGANSKFWSYGLDASLPVFEGGTLLSKREAAIENYRAAMGDYRQTVLNALAQVADTLRALDHDAQALQAENEAVDMAGQGLRLVNANFTAGIANYTDVLIADAQYHQTMITALQLKAVRYQDTVALFTALGGGWWN